MPNDNIVEQDHTIGSETFLESESPNGKYAVEFEDDGEAGYFYALDNLPVNQHVFDTLHIYDVTSICNRFMPSNLRIVWSKDGLKAGLMLNGEYQAVFDFEARRGWCRLGSPPPQGDWSPEGHAWDERAITLFD